MLLAKCKQCGGRMREYWPGGLCSRCYRHARADAYRAELQTPRQCEVCGRDFYPGEVHARFCSNACRQKAYRQRQTSSVIIIAASRDRPGRPVAKRFRSPAKIDARGGEIVVVKGPSGPLCSTSASARIPPIAGSRPATTGGAPSRSTCAPCHRGLREGQGPPGRPCWAGRGADQAMTTMITGRVCPWDVVDDDRVELARGCFGTTSLLNRRRIPLRWEHGEEIGRATAFSQLRDGLHGTFRLYPGTLGEHALAMIRDGAARGLSPAYAVLDC
jgi:predicted nucleic acid-binding Zn ribbon protein